MGLIVHFLLLLLNLSVVDVVVVVHQFVNGAVGSQFDDAVGNGLDELMVVAREQNITLELHQVVVESLDAFKVKVVGGSVEYKTVGVLELHTCNHTTHLLTS